MNVDKTLVDKSFVTQDEGYNPASNIGKKVERILKTVTLDTYNKQYLIKIIVIELGGNDDVDDDSE